MLIREMMATLEMAESRHISRKWIKLELAAGFWKGAEGQIVDGGAWTLDLLTNCSCVVVCTDVTQDGVIIITLSQSLCFVSIIKIICCLRAQSLPKPILSLFSVTWFRVRSGKFPNKFYKKKRT